MLKVDVEGEDMGSASVVDLLLADITMLVDVGSQAIQRSLDVPNSSADALPKTVYPVWEFQHTE